jgi:hypothetical protein
MQNQPWREVEKGSAEDGLPLRGPNNWPDEPALGLTAFKAPMNAYYAACCALARRLMVPFESALGLEKDFFLDKFSHPTALLRPLKYAAAASDPEAGVMAAGAHSDYGVLTILAIDGTPGLQVRRCWLAPFIFVIFVVVLFCCRCFQGANTFGISIHHHRPPLERHKSYTSFITYTLRPDVDVPERPRTLLRDPNGRRRRRVEGGAPRPRSVRVQRGRPVRAAGLVHHSRVSDWLRGPYWLSSTGVLVVTPGCQIGMHGPYWLSSIEPCFVTVQNNNVT